MLDFMVHQLVLILLFIAWLSLKIDMYKINKKYITDNKLKNDRLMLLEADKAKLDKTYADIQAVKARVYMGEKNGSK